MVDKSTNTETKNKVTSNSFRGKSVMSLAILLLSVVVVNLASDMWHKRIDLTKEGRYTLSGATVDLTQKLEDVVYIQIFLDGEFPSEYRRLKNATRDMLNEFRHAADGNIEYRFEDLLTDKTTEEKENILQQLSKKGLQITQPEIDEDEAATAKYIIPAGLVIYKNREYPLNLLKREFGQPLEQEINGSIELLEYEIGNIIRKCVTEKEVKIAFAEGHSELDEFQVADISKSLQEFYRVDRININILDTACTKPFLKSIQKNPERGGEILLNGVIEQMKSYKAIIIAKPRISFLDEELFLLDQYVMAGGKLIVLAESLIAEIDSVARYGSLMTADYNLNINDLLFRYGARINPDLIQDLNSHGIPVMSADGSGKPGFRPWIFYPLFAPDGDHAIVRNLTAIWGQFVSSIDTLPNKEVTKTVLLHSGENSRLANNPVNISINMVGMKFNPEMFTKPNNISAVLLEGKFKSVFAHRPAIKENSAILFKEEIANNSMIIISDGDLIANQVNKTDRQIYPLGYDRFASKAFNEPIIFANKKFFLNCVDYLCDDSNLIDVRAKKIVLRLLDKVKVKAERTKWQLINMVLPVVVIILFGFVNSFFRKRKYT
jgi:gliding motility-associatede transport system auxiliary component